MKRTLAVLLVVLAAVLAGGLSSAADAPLRLTHTLTGYTQGNTKLTADYSLRIENRGNAPLSEVNLSLVPVPPTFMEATTLNLGHFAPRETREVFLQVETATRITPSRLEQATIFWAGTYVDGEGKTMEFPARSMPGGAK